MNLLRVLVAYFVATGVACAQNQVTYMFSGEISDVPSELVDGFSIGDTFSGQFKYDSRSVDSHRNDPLRGNYNSSISNLRFDIGDYKISNVGLGDIAAVDSSSGHDSYIVTALVDGPQISGANPLFGSLQLRDRDGDAVEGDGIHPPNLERFSDPLATFDFLHTSNELIRMEGVVTNLSQVPEPTSLALLLTALAGLGRYRRSSIHRDVFSLGSNDSVAD